MADKYFKINKNDLPPVNIDYSTYDIRMRIVSEDQNRSSFWSPVYAVDAPTFSTIPNTQYSIIVSSTTPKTVKIIWQDQNGFDEYDVFAVMSYVNFTTKEHKSGDAFAKLAHNGTFPVIPTAGDYIYTFGIDTTISELDGLRNVYSYTTGSLSINCSSSISTYNPAVSISGGLAGAVLIGNKKDAEINDAWTYMATTSSKSYEFVVPTNIRVLKIRVQRCSYTKKYSSSQLLFETPVQQIF